MNRYFFYPLLSLMAFALPLQAQDNEGFNHREEARIALENDLDDFHRENFSNFTFKTKTSSLQQEALETITRTVVLSEAGTLATQLGEDMNRIDTLIVRGPINDEDLSTMWSASFYGVLQHLDIGQATLESGVIPRFAFCRPSDQVDPSTGLFYTLWLKSIILPEGVTEIDESAFSYATKLEEVTFPSTLRKVGKYAFSDCTALRSDPLVFPEGFEEIGKYSFYHCPALRGKVELPSSIRKIDERAFWQAKISSINLPEGLETLGDGVFQLCLLKEVILPESCQDLSGDGHLGFNQYLEKVYLPEGIDSIPDRFFTSCINLREVSLPSTVVHIGGQAFHSCNTLKELKLPENLVSIGERAFTCLTNLEEICFPPTMREIGPASCDGWDNIKKIYCAAPVPPVCTESKTSSGHSHSSPFGSYDYNDGSGTPSSTPVYIPKGTLEAYKNAPGWNYFYNFIETDEFPLTEIDAIQTSTTEGDGRMYDLMGRRINKPAPGQIYIQNGKKFVCPTNK